MATGLSRVTIVAPRGRLDVAVPADVPLADLLPNLLDATGDPASGNGAGMRDGWSLSRLGSPPLDTSRTPAELSVRDGELLYLRPRGEDAPVMVFDDLVYALASGTTEKVARWTAETNRAAALAAGLLVVAVGLPVLLAVGAPFTTAGLTAFGVACVLLVVAVVFARSFGQPRAGTAYAALAALYAGVGGLLATAGERPLTELTVAHATVAATAFIVTAVIGSVGVPLAAPLFLGMSVCAGATTAALGLATTLETGLTGAAALTAVVAYAALPATPILAYRLTGLPRPSVPTDRDQLRQESQTVDGVNVTDLSRRVNAYLSSMLAAIALVSAGTAVLVARAGLPGMLLAGVLGMLPVLRSRWFGARSQRLALLLGAGVALGALIANLVHLIGSDVRLLAVVGAAVAVAVFSLGFGVTGDRQQSPFWGRVLDLLETLLIVAVAPLAIWVSGILTTVRAIRG